MTRRQETGLPPGARGCRRDHFVHFAARNCLAEVSPITQRGFDQVRFAATVGADDAGQPSSNDKLRLAIDEGF